MNAKGKGGCHRHDSDRDGSTVHVDRCTKRNRYRICITVKSHFFTDFHIDWDIGCRTSCEKSSQSTSLQTVEDQRIWILADTPVYQKRVCYKIDKKHTSDKQKKQFSICCEDIQAIGRYCVEYKTEDTEWSHIDDPGNNCGNSISNIFKYILGHVIGSTECKAKKNCPHKDADIVCVHKGRYRVGNQIQKEIVENLDNTLRCCCICSGSSGKCQFYRKCHTCKYGNDCGKYSTEHVKYDNCLDDTAVRFTCVTQRTDNKKEYQKWCDRLKCTYKDISKDCDAGRPWYSDSEDSTENQSNQDSLYQSDVCSFVPKLFHISTPLTF